MAKLKPTSTAVLTANDLATGAIVYWTGADWAKSLAFAQRATGTEAQTTLETAGKAEEAANVVVGAYLMALDPVTGTPIELRERQRLLGPSIALPSDNCTSARG